MLSSESQKESAICMGMILNYNVTLQPPCSLHSSEDFELATRSLDVRSVLAQQSGVLMSGWLYRTSRPKWSDDITRASHEHRQHRKFKLTEHSLEYSHLLQRVCLHVVSLLLHSIVHVVSYN